MICIYACMYVCVYICTHTYYCMYYMYVSFIPIFLVGSAVLFRTHGTCGARMTFLLWQGLRFMWFNKYKGIISEDGARPLTDLENLLGGMSAGCFSTLGNNPFDVVKTRMQGVDAAKYKNTIDCFRQVLPSSRTHYMYAFTRILCMWGLPLAPWYKCTYTLGGARAKTGEPPVLNDRFTDT